MIIDGVEVKAIGFEASPSELENYLEYVAMRVDGDIVSVYVKMCDDGKVDVEYVVKGQKFERIRRITGYLTGDLTSWNESKQAEERDRVKHDTRL